MRRIVPYAAAWVAAATLAVLVAWQGVAVVGDQVTADRPQPLSRAQVEAAVRTPTTTSPTISPTTVSTPSTVPGAAPPPTTQVTTAFTTVATAAAETRTYNLVGGSTSLRFEPSGVTVLWANPNAGYEVSVEPEHLNGVKVEFESDTHRSRVDGWWDGGPQDRLREEDR